MKCRGEQVSLWAQAACQWECVARKPGNVHRTRDFQDTTLLDFLASAAAIGPVLGRAAGRGLGETILEAVEVTREAVGRNTNLGLILAMAPLAAVPAGRELRSGVEEVLRGTTVEDTVLAYRAIRLASPGGLGTAEEQDASVEPTVTLLEAMRLAEDRDTIARLWSTGYRDLFDVCLPSLGGGLQHTGCLEGAILLLHLHLMALCPDSLIARKAGVMEAETSARMAGETARAGWPHRQAGWQALAELDRWLRADGNRRNPGTTADLVGATLFAGLLTGQLSLPSVFPWWTGEGIWP
jgi:triphosphoribosyl-dephospho-CoA synthase